MGTAIVVTLLVLLAVAGGLTYAHHHGARCDRDGPVVTGKHVPGLRCHSDAGSQFTSIRYGERLAEIGAVPSIGTGSTGDESTG